MHLKEIILGITDYLDDIKKVLESIHFGLIVEVITNIIVLSILFKLTDVFESKIKARIQKNKNDQMVKILPIFSRIIKSVVFFIMLAAFLQNHGYSVSSLIAGFGITGLAVGFAANTTIANIFGTLAIISDKSYKIGDYIQISGLEGTVEDINMRSTKLRTLDNAVTIIPNGTIAGGNIVNLSKIHRRRFYETFGVTYDTSDEKLKRAVQIIEEIFHSNPNVHADYIVFLDKLADSSINITANAYLKTKDLNKFRKMKEEILFEIIKKYREEGLDFAFPSQSIYLSKNEN